MNPNDKRMFYKYLDSCKHYFEFGSGGSTIQASLRQNIQSITSVESDNEWYKRISQMLSQDNRVNMKYVHVNSIPGKFGHPFPKGSVIANKYAGLIEGHSPDIVLIDGRFRVACALKCFCNISNNSVILFDDFLNRPEYHIVLNYYDIIEKTDDNCMVVLKKKECPRPTSDIIRIFDRDPS